MNKKTINADSMPRDREIVIDFRILWSQIVANWRWIVASVSACVFVGLAYLYLAHPTVTVTGKMEIIDRSKKSNGVSAGLAMLNNLPMGLGGALGGSLGGSLGIDSEKEILASSSLVRDVVYDLGLHTEYYLSKWGRTRMIYKNQPVNVTIDKAHLQWMDSELPLLFHKIKLVVNKNASGYRVETTLFENKKKIKLPDQNFASLPAVIKTEAGNLTISQNFLLSAKDQIEYADGYTLKVNIVPPLEAANSLISHLSIEPPSKKIANILSITLEDESPVRGIEFIKNLVDAYNERANFDKNEEAHKTDEFVNDRLAKIDAELGSSDAEWEDYKKKYQITDPKVDAQEVMTKKSYYETQLVKLGTQLQLQDYLSEYVNNPANMYDIIPLSMGVSSVEGENGQGVVLDVSAITRHNSLVSHRKELLKSMSEKAPQVQRVTETIEELHPDIVTAMARNRHAIQIQKQSVLREYDHYLSRVGSTPQQERALTEIGRQREIKQGVYLLMLQKREETAMELANVTNKGKLIDEIQMNKNSKAPKAKIVLVAVLFIGMFIPCFILVVTTLLKTKISTSSDLITLIKHDFMGLLSQNSNNDIRALRTNLLLQLKPGQKIILVTSGNDGDGKSFFSEQLVASLSQIGKKAVLCRADLLSEESRAQFAEFLKSENFSWPGVGSYHHADILSSDDFGLLISQLKEKYDYVIIDSPSLSRCNDTYQIGSYADVTCFVVKSGSTDKAIVKSAEVDNHLPNLCYVLNSIDMNKGKNKYFSKHAFLFMAVLMLFASCGSSEKMVYLENLNDVKIENSRSLFDARIMPKDILSITVSTINPEAGKPFNLIVPTVVAGEITTTTTQPVMQSYLVNNDGSIDFPIIGEIKVAGLTKTECESLILKKISSYMSESEKPIVTVRMSSYSIAVLGEVKNPGNFPVSREKVNIFEALAMAGDMTIYGVRDRVRLIREDANGKKEIHVLDLTDANIINSPYYYLQQNDMVYVEPSNIKKQDARVGSMTNLWFSATSILVSLATIIVTIAK